MRNSALYSRASTDSRPVADKPGSAWMAGCVPSERLVAALLHRLHDISHNSGERTEIVRGLLPHINEVQGEEAQEVIDLLDGTMDTAQLDSDLFRKCLQALGTICGSTGILPTSHVLTEGLTKLGDMPVASGGFADVWLGNHSDLPVAIKAVRIYRGDDQQALKQAFSKEIVIWKRLLHENILPLIGVSTALFPFCMVSPWMANGNLTEYLSSKLVTNRVKLLLDIVNGVEFLHSSDIVHGDLKGANILINESGRACLADFGLMTTMSKLGALNATTLVSRRNGTIRWMAPELLDPEAFGMPASPNLSFSAASDIYALAMVTIELFTGNKPFNQLPNEPSVIIKVIQGERPTRPEHSYTLGLSDHVWELVKMCWDQDSSRRPTISFVLDRLKSTIKSDPAPLLQALQYKTLHYYSHANGSTSSVPNFSVFRTGPPSKVVTSQGDAKPKSGLCDSMLVCMEKHSDLFPKKGFRDHRNRIGLAKWPKRLTRVLFPCMNL